MTAAHLALIVGASGPHLDQLWTKIANKDLDIVKMAEVKKKRWDTDLRETFEDRIHAKSNYYYPNDPSRFILKMAPIISGGLNPILLKELIEIMCTIDYITTMGGIDIEEYAKQNRELALAIDFCTQNRTNTHKLKVYS